MEGVETGSIERFYNFYTPICDCCEKELPAEESFQDAVDAKRRAGWKSRKDDRGQWEDICPDCLREERAGQ